VGIRVFFHEGIGCGKFYTANDCDSMLLHHEGLNEATVGELRMATSTLQEGDVARERAAGQGARLGRGTLTRGCRKNLRTRMRTPISVIASSSVKVRSSVGFRPGQGTGRKRQRTG
jgi:hypothetical protein